ncbi:hypothetical protein BU24DRAFT_491146 [Aaosphaeria arxii CBS 175.79]|uniref:Zn(2)-C6 fungal-type domain-containing protein n=1 Tax=Aaosphaeria arxii CBS 175.79 TaxID=1450172 RepID=A0A6A5XY77_9PLEO|nr:uncharacterized protein BU24DRAFT_491146 [Aaosphaeria arxii CBS 175.79]KAF2018112.1 hypothetical protein BU24DRAFT_491146 [Aaosphaeria arxii CBS 175.79]
MSATTTQANSVRRAKIACKACNARRVKCDIADGQPCWHCRTRSIPCELIESRRGKYVRKGKRSNPRAPLDANVRPTDANKSRARISSPSSEVPGEELSSFDTASNLQGQESDISYVIELIYRPNDQSVEAKDVHYSIPASFAAPRPPKSETWQSNTINVPTALVMPPKDLCDQLVRTFFQLIHPAYPVFDREQFLELYLEDRASPLVLHTICLLGFTIGNDDLVVSAGFADRDSAREFHYLRAKALYDVGYDEDRLNVVACLLLMGFWWNKSDDHKDTCYWVGCATVLAQNLGLHRASRNGVSRRQQSLRRRVWWSIYVRDRHTAAAFGRPCRIQDIDCDVQPLTELDFTFDSAFDTDLIPAQETYHIDYTLEMARLARILGDILVAEFSPGHSSIAEDGTSILAGRLSRWKSQIPRSLCLNDPDGTVGASFWAMMLDIAYQNYHVLLYRPKKSNASALDKSYRDLMVRKAADSITRMAEDMLAFRVIHYGQIHLVPALFGALATHTFAICHEDHTRRRLAENKSRQCLLALGELAKSWPVSIWIAKAFIKLMKRLTEDASGGSLIKISSRVVKTRHSRLPEEPEQVLLREHAPIAIADQWVSSGIYTENEPDPAVCEVGGRILPNPDTLAVANLQESPLGDTLDIDMFLQDSLEPMLSDPFDGAHDAWV